MTLTAPGYQRIYRQAALISIVFVAFAARAFAAGFAHGTSEVIVIRPGSVTVAADSKEVTSTLLADGSAVRGSKDSCKLRSVHHVLVVGAGLLYLNGFQALDSIRDLIDEDTPLRQVADRVSTEFPARFRGPIGDLVSSTPSFRRYLTERYAMQIALVKVESGLTEVEAISFRAIPSDTGVEISADRRHCPGDCSATGAIWALGAHDAIDRFLSTNHPATNDTAAFAATLLDQEYAAEPDTVGGAVSLIRLDPSGVTKIQAGECGDDLVPVQASTGNSPAAPSAEAVRPLLLSALEAQAAAAADLICHERLDRYSDRSSGTKEDSVDAQLRVIDGIEEYSEITRGSHRYRKISDLPGAWTSGEMNTMLRATIHDISTLTIRTAIVNGETGEKLIQAEFQSPIEYAEWFLHVDSQAYPTAFTGTAWFDEKTGMVRRLHWSTTYIAAPFSVGIRKLDWDAVFGPVMVGGRSVIAPVRAYLHVAYEDHCHRLDRAEIRFSDYQRYGSTSSIVFESAIPADPRTPDPKNVM